MKILKEGKKELRYPNADTQTVNFTCEYCGCEFQAYLYEIERSTATEYFIDGLVARCTCPSCRHYAHLYNRTLNTKTSTGTDDKPFSQETNEL